MVTRQRYRRPAPAWPVAATIDDRTPSRATSRRSAGRGAGNARSSKTTQWAPLGWYEPGTIRLVIAIRFQALMTVMVQISWASSFGSKWRAASS